MQELTNSSLALNDIAEDLQAGIAAFKLLEGTQTISVPAPRKKPHPRKTIREPEERVALSPIVRNELRQGVDYVKEKMKIANEEQMVKTESNGQTNGKK
jgi:hypothetical protein